MALSSLLFIYLFLPAALLLYFLMPSGGKLWTVFGLSLAFCVLNAGVWAAVPVFMVINAYITGLSLSRFKGKRARIIIIFSLAADLAALCLVRLAAEGEAVLPGAAVMTLKTAYYVVSVGRGKETAQKDPAVLGAYISFFPALSGGITDSFDVSAPQLREIRPKAESLCRGIELFLVGIGKKMLIANPLGMLSSVCNQAEETTVLLAWMNAFAAALGLYFELSGYSDMARGTGLCFGLELPENFKYPLTARSVSDLLRRSFISLRTMFRGLLPAAYKNEKGQAFKHIVLILIACLGAGLFFGFGWNYTAFGILLFIAVLAEHILKGDKAWMRFICRIFTLLFILILALLLTNKVPLRNMSAMLAIGGEPLINRESLYDLRRFLLPIAAAMMGATPFPRYLYRRFADAGFGKRANVLLTPLFYGAVLILSTAVLAESGFERYTFLRF